MYRVLLAAGVLISLTGCSLNSSSLSSGFAGSDSDTSSLRRTASSRQGPLGGEPTARATTASATPQKFAKLDDKAPQGSYERAPPGALGDRNYSATQLDADKARELINAYRKEKGLKPLKLNAELSERGQGAFARSRQMGPHFAFRLRRVQSVGPRQARRL